MKNSKEIQEAISELEANLKMFEAEKEKTHEYDNVKLGIVNEQIRLTEARIRDLNVALAYSQTADHLFGFLTEIKSDLENGQVNGVIEMITDLVKSQDPPPLPEHNPYFKLWTESQMIKSTDYFEQVKELDVVFKNGKSYIYMGFPADKYTELLRAESIGKYINAVVKPNYKCRSSDEPLNIVGSRNKPSIL